ncbi:uncharacterized protein ATNIH1004_010837 [Aspergillus tanneri]|uniref:Uncharacterized protein n=1 Tax=Aspergillus tanneri TaxID=1220188 RepID=A0A5M9M561_9EURO|nr:uncharacterized protein ATNIH1004_010837 [Aspergillus tanneri]KAA8641898.1 hypothetical protein ATNIH1004_010837 [Aspergillus tanneri]
MAPWEIVELESVWMYFHGKCSQPFKEIADDLMQYGDIMTEHTLDRMGPAFIFKFLNMNEFLDRRDLILVNG